MKVTMTLYGCASKEATLELTEAQVAKFLELKKEDDLENAWDYLEELMYEQDFTVTEFDVTDSKLDWE